MQVDILLEETGGYSAHIPSLHASTQGDTWDELMKNIHECIQLAREYQRDQLHIDMQSLRFYLNVMDTTYAS